MDKKEKTMKVGATILVAGLLSAGGFGLGDYTNQNDLAGLNGEIATLTADIEMQEELANVLAMENAALTSEVEVLKNTPAEVITETVEVEVPVEVIVEVEVENPLNGILVDFIEDEMDWDREDVISFAQFEVDSEELAKEYLKDNWYDILDDEDLIDDYFDIYRKSEIKLQKIYDDPELTDIDHDDESATYEFEFKVRAKESGETAEYEKFLVELEVFENDVFVEEVEITQ